MTEFGTGGAVCDYIYAEGFSRIVGILTCIPEGNGAACNEFRADEPVVGSQRSVGLVIIGNRAHAVGAFIYIVIAGSRFDPFPVESVAVVIADGPAFSEGIGFEAPTGYCAGFGSYGVLGGRYGSVGGAAAAGNFNEVEVEPEHVGDVIVTERNLNGLTCICADVYAALLIGVGSGEVTEFGTGGAVCDYIYAEGFSRIVGILTCIPEGNGAACGECRADEPVVGIQCSAAAECAVLIGSGCHAVGAFVYVVVGSACIHPFPVVAVAVVIADGPAFSEGIGFEAPTGCCAGFGSYGVLGGRYRGVGSAAAGNDFNIGCVILAEEVYGEVVGVACFEGVIVCTAAYITLAGSDPDTVAGSRVGKAPVISTCGYLDGNGVVNNNVAGGGAAVCIYGNLILECIVQTCGCVAALGERTFYGDLIAVCGCICVEEHLVTGTVAEYVTCGEADGGGGCVGITIPCFYSDIGVNGCAVVVPTGELVALMCGSCGEVGFVKDGACFNGVAAGDGLVGEAVNEGYIIFGNFDGSNGHVVPGVKSGNFCAGADGAARSGCTGCGINNVQTVAV